MKISEISVAEVSNLRIGNAQNEEGKTGVTVLYFPEGAKVGVDISGGGPASRETPLTSPVTADNPINAIVLSGGSAYGLAASDGVARCLEENGIGYNTGFCLVPLVCQSCLFDLGYGSATIRPDSALGYEACQNALNGTDDRCGNVGAGTGATVGKLKGMRYSTKTGLGIHTVSAGPLTMTAVVALNALGDVFDWKTGTKIAGMLNADRTEFDDVTENLYQMMEPRDMFTGNTTIGAIITNGKFSKSELTKLASMARNGYARTISPVGTMADGDSIYAASIGEVSVDINMAGSLAAEVMCEALKKAATSAKVSEEEFLANIIE